MSDTITVGDVSITRVIEWQGAVATVDVIFPESAPDDWESQRELLAPDFWNPSDNAFNIHLQTWVVRSGGMTILVDTGAGNGRDRPNMPAFNDLHTGYLAALARAGVAPEDVDLVVSTHLHGDHVGWNTVLTGGEFVPTFPNAKYLMARAELDFWRPGSPYTSISADAMLNVFEDSVAPVLASGQVVEWEGRYAIDGDLALEIVPGHTPGMSVLKIESGADRAVLASDIVHSPFQVSEHHVNSCFCEDASLARESRARVLRWAADERAIVLPSHLGGHSAFEVSERAGRFEISGWAGFDRLTTA